MRIVVPLLIASMLLVSAGCANVKPWERDLLARREMGWEPDPATAKRENHIYASKESTLPGGTGGGGGCGCN
jgi:hypothetical protein